jgi:hypothetical protein
MGEHHSRHYWAAATKRRLSALKKTPAGKIPRAWYCVFADRPFFPRR